MSGSDWVVTVRVTLRNFVDHDEQEAAILVRELINDECGFAGLCDWPDDYEILAVEPVTASTSRAVQE